MRRIRLFATIVGLVLIVSSSARAEWPWKRKLERVTVGGEVGPPLNNVPRWAAQAALDADRPLPVRSTGRRPWAYAMSHVNTPTTRLANWYGGPWSYRNPGSYSQYR